MATLESEYTKLGRAWPTYAGALGLTFLVFLAIASTRLSLSKAKPEFDPPLETYRMPVKSQVTKQSLPQPKSQRFTESINFEYELQDEPAELQLNAIDVSLGHDLAASSSLGLSLDRRFSASKPTVGEIGEFEVFENTEVDQKPLLVYSTEPTIPYGLRKYDAEVVLFYFVDTRGRASNVSVLDSTHDEFNEYAKETVVRWRFKPARKGGKAVNCWIQQTIKFNKGSTSPFSIN